MSSSNSSAYRDPFSPGDDPRRQKGRRTGSRAKLAQRFFEDMYAAWEEQGPSVIARAFFHDPVQSMSVVARLMPQKIEVSAPTDGMSDERLAEMLDFAERMAGLKAAQAKVIQGEAVTPHRLDHEKPETAILLEGGGGGPLREMGGGGKYTQHTTPAAPENRPESGSENATEEGGNGLNVLQPEPVQGGDEQNRQCTSCGVALQPHEIELCDRCGAPSVLPYPVGKPGPLSDHAVERRNRAALAETDIDPASLF